MTSPVGASQSGAFAAAVQAAQNAASAAQARAAEMQKSIEALRQEAQANREAVARLTRALEEAQGRTPGWLWAALAALGGLSALMFVRMRRLQLGGSATPWWSANAASVAVPPGHGPDETSSRPVAAASAPAGPLGSDTPSTAPPLSSLSFLAKRQPGAADSAPVARVEQPVSQLPQVESEPDWDSLPTVSVEDLLDLQQQAEFFSDLGQDDAALKLLADHLTQTRGDYPLPYLQVMDICRRRSDKAGFERIRSRLQQRFGISWPGWHEQSQDQRRLEDCSDLLFEIELVWKDPAKAMGSLAGLLRAANRVDCLEPPVPVTASVAAASDALDIDFDLGMDQASASSAGLDLTLEFDLPTPSTPAGLAAVSQGVQAAKSESAVSGTTGLSNKALPAELRRALPDIDLPLSDEGVRTPASALAAARHVTGGPSTEAAVDLKLDETWNPNPAVPPQGQEPKSGAQTLPLQFPDLDLPGAEELAVAQGAAVDLDLTLDTPDLAALPPPLSVDEERAAGRSGLFSEEFNQVDKR